MTIDHQQLRDLASKATPGEWRQGNVEKHHIFVESQDAHWLGHERVLLRMNKHFPHEADAAFIAAASPSTVIALLDELEQLRAALTKISAIRDSIIGQQGFNWSEHAYPLVAVLNAAGFLGAGYEIARRNLGTLIDQRDAALTRAREAESALAEAHEKIAKLTSLVEAEIRIAKAAANPVTAQHARSTLACGRCGEHHLLAQFSLGDRVVFDGKAGEVVSWTQYGGPMSVRVAFEARDEAGELVRANFDPCQLSLEPF